VFRSIHITAPNGVQVRVLEFLLHHRAAVDLLGVAALLPELVIALRFVRQFHRAQLSKPHLRSAGVEES
jgi:hypothetical protein